ncbi:flagellar export chaperone FlgN [Ferrimonas lipolytica]|uniref:Flagellar protein FlgN n=1 Tax=Ferrimonas lipolytica TaxID=2724191 RepID=A0A6H1UEN7_9GAMM|nr:flagellar export chaperone FlgN [Ferrimonas lipolytica]QIZ76803.1 flagellar protein FlgN [Ferrimonas lipolytica]
MSTNELIRALAKSIQQDVRHYQAIETQLQQQRQLMLDRALEQLTQLNFKLDKAYSQLQHHSQQRQQWLQTLGFSGDSDGFAALLTRLPKAVAQQLQDSHGKLLAQMRSCQMLNDRNGQLLIQQQQRLNQLLNPQQAQQQLNDYGPIA